MLPGINPRSPKYSTLKRSRISPSNCRTPRSASLILKWWPAVGGLAKLGLGSSDEPELSETTVNIVSVNQDTNKTLLSLEEARR